MWSDGIVVNPPDDVGICRHLENPTQYIYNQLWLDFTKYEDYKKARREIPHDGRHVLFEVMGKGCYEGNDNISIYKYVYIHPSNSLPIYIYLLRPPQTTMLTRHHHRADGELGYKSNGKKKHGDRITIFAEYVGSRPLDRTYPSPGPPTGPLPKWEPTKSYDGTDSVVDAPE